MATIPESLASALADHQAGRLTQAEQAYRQILQAVPDHADAQHLLGLIEYQRGAFEAAIEWIGRAIACDGRQAVFHCNLAAAYRAAHRAAEACACCRRAIALRPDYAEAHFNLGNACMDAGQLDEALAAYQQAVHLKPDFAEAHCALGGAWRRRTMLDHAAASLRRALALRPNYVAACDELVHVSRDQEQLDEAAEYCRRAGQLRTGAAAALSGLRRAALCPLVFDSGAAIDAWRRRLGEEVERLAAEGVRASPDELAASGAEPPYHLQFHGCDNRPLKEAWARIFRHGLPDHAPRGGAARARIALLVTLGHEGIFVKWWQPIVERMRSERFELVIVCKVGGAARLRAAFGEKIELLILPTRLAEAVEAIRAARFDVVYHWEVGSDTANYFLPMFRLAPVQCTSWGIQMTTGLAQVDYYLSSALIEPEGAESHYTERLIRARTLLAYHLRAPLPAAPRPREAFGLGPGQHLYLCAQHLGKFHPDFDPILGRILEQDPAGRVVIVEYPNPYAAARLRQRFARTVGAVCERIVFLPRQSYGDYLSLLSAADVVLDPLYYSSGTTSFEALSLGQPLVTWPWRFQIGRSVLACYRRMGIAGCVAQSAEEYARVAVALGTDADYRHAVRTEIAAASGELLEDLAAVREYEQIFEQLVDTARSRR